MPLDAEQRHYLKRVMRCGKGDPVVLFNGGNGEFHARFDGEDGCLVDRVVAVDRELPMAIDIIQGACRGERIAQVLQKGTELGAASFAIVRCRRSMVKLSGERLAQRLSRWRQIVVEAAEQCGRTKIPAVSWCDSLKAVSVSPDASRWLLHLQDAHPWRQARPSILKSQRVALAVGPEGGFSGDDLEALRQQGFQPLQFGARTLRTETAAPALLAAIQALL